MNNIGNAWIKDMMVMGLKDLFIGKNKKYKEHMDAYSMIQAKSVPKHVAIIMDGNGRWAKKHQLPRIAGHRQGVEALRNIIQTTSQLGISYLSLYAFSTENWKRPKTEVKALMSLLVEFLQKEIYELHKNNVKIFMLGDIDGLPADTKAEVLRAMEMTKENKGLQVNIAINYGSRFEMIKAVKYIIQDISNGNITIEDINEELFSQHLDTKGIPDPDLLIRTSGEYRLSNFLLYQLAYTELVFTEKEVLWPDFTKEKYLETILQYQNRTRRYGGIDDREDD